MQTVSKSGLYLFVLAAICGFKGESVGLDGTGSQRMTSKGNGFLRSLIGKLIQTQTGANTIDGQSLRTALF